MTQYYFASRIHRNDLPFSFFSSFLIFTTHKRSIKWHRHNRHEKPWNIKDIPGCQSCSLLLPVLPLSNLTKYHATLRGKKWRNVDHLLQCFHVRNIQLGGRKSYGRGVARSAPSTLYFNETSGSWSAGNCFYLWCMLQMPYFNLKIHSKLKACQS